MLQVSHLTKIYKTKGGEVRALDDVSLRFPEKGMIFLLGKSGSGKSTLLNVTGGLDSPTSGEIIVKGKSSKSFSQSDFDSYRNTFIGFIFQEYNILNEFTVEDNIALALELQGKPKNKKAIAALLEEVDLTGYAKRKPNTLSGGQKQRIAIARALIKSPEIIMADEPTGALDSATGKQVFDTLKKLSRDKLVIIVSHDRDFAEQYADRIIELKDGKILSDVSKTEEERATLTENITAIGDTLCIKSGAELTDTDFKEIKGFLKNSGGEVIIASGERDVASFKDVNRITDDGTKEVFRDTDEELIEKKVFKPTDARFIRSKLPMRHAVKMGASGLKTKPIRLMLTSLLCTVAFIMFGLLSTMMLYDSTATLTQTLMDSDYELIKLEGNYRVNNKNYENGELTYEYESSSNMRFSDDEVRALAEKYGDGSFGIVNGYTSFPVSTRSSYYLNDVSGFAYLDEDNPLRESKIIYGSYPEADDEILISRYLADVMVNCGIIDPAAGTAITIQSASDAVGKKIQLDNRIYTVSGVFACPELPVKFDELKESTQYDTALSYELDSYLSDGIFTIVFLTKDGLKEMASRFSWSYEQSIFEGHELCITLYDKDGSYSLEETNSSGRYAAFSKVSEKYEVFWIDSNKTTLGDKEVLVLANNISEIISGELSKALSEIEKDIEAYKKEHGYYSLLDDIRYRLEADYYMGNAYELVDQWELGALPDINEPYYSLYLEWQTAFEPIKPLYDEYRRLSTLSSKAWSLNSSVYGYTDPITNEWVEVTLTAELRQEFLTEFIEFLREYGTGAIKCAAKLYNREVGISVGDLTTYTIVGFFDSNQSWGLDIAVNDERAENLWGMQKVTLSYYYETETQYKAPKDALYSAVYVPYDRTPEATALLVDIYSNDEYDANDTMLRIRCSIVEGFESIDYMVLALSKVFLYAGIAIALFAALLLSNFISVSISHKKREIGILRAVGARSIDVFKIFFSESFIIASVCAALSTLASIGLCELLNTETSAIIGASLFVFNHISIGLLVAIAVFTAVVATFLPVYNAAKKKPVDSIRSL